MSPKVNHKDQFDETMSDNLESKGAGHKVRSAGGAASMGPIQPHFPPDALARMRMLSELLKKPDKAS